MTDNPDSVAIAKIKAERARARLNETVSELHERLKPDVLVREGVDRLRVRSSELADEVMDVARARPGLIGGVGGSMLLLWLRRPLGRLGRRLFFSSDETSRQAGNFNDSVKK